MKRLMTALVAVALILASGAFAAAKLMPNLVRQPTRFSGSCCVYAGAPALQVTLSMIEAGGGPSSFDTVSLLKRLTGPLFGAELHKLTAQYGKAQINQFVSTFDFVVSDSLRIVGEDHVALPSQPNPSPTNGPALARALWGAGQTGMGFNVEVMLDRAVSHPIHLQVMRDIDAKYGLAADAQYHAILTTAMHDLARAYHLSQT
jgi:hypothetical protein